MFYHFHHSLYFFLVYLESTLLAPLIPPVQCCPLRFHLGQPPHKSPQRPRFLRTKYEFHRGIKLGNVGKNTCKEVMHEPLYFELLNWQHKPNFYPQSSTSTVDILYFQYSFTNISQSKWISFTLAFPKEWYNLDDYFES